MTHEECKNSFVELYYNELPASSRTEVERHIAGCSVCSAAYRQFAGTLEFMNQRAEATPSEHYSANLSRRLEQEYRTSVNPAPKTAPIYRLHIPSWSYGIAAMVILAVGIYLGKTFFADKEHTQNTQRIAMATDSSRAMVAKQVTDYLDRSKVLLLGVVNSSSDETPGVSLERQQAISRDLVQQAVYLKTALNNPNDENVRSLIGDLEIVLLQLANYSAENGIPLVEMVKQGVDKKSILLKINLEEINSLGQGAHAQIKSSSKSPKNPKSRI